MWNRKDLKLNARKVVKKNYWTAIVVCFIIAFLTGEFGTSIIGVLQGEDTVDPLYVLHNERITNNETADEQKIENEKQKVANFDKKIKEKINSLNDTQIKIAEAIESNLNNITKTQKYIFKIWDAIQSFNINQIGIGVGFSITACLTFIFTIFVADPLIVGGKRYFIKARKRKNTKIGEMGEVFKNGNWFNVAKIMFLRNIFNFLWYLTIIGGIIKTYEYKMIPFILAENPKISTTEAFKLSKKMMKSNKWKTFILDVSFILWNIASVFTFGLINILYANPYKSATFAELYMYLRKNAINDKYEYFEQLNDKSL